MIANLVLKEPELVLEKLDQPIVNIPRNLKRGLIKSFRKDVLVGGLDSEIMNLASSIESNRKEFKNNISESIESALKMVMEADIEPKNKVSLLSRINYEVVELNRLPLGDSMVLFAVKTGKKTIYKTFLSRSDKLIAVVLPLSPNLLLVGSNSSFTPTSNTIRKAIVSCSFEFYIASNLNDEFLDLLATLNTNSNLLSKRERQDLFASIIDFSKKS